MSHHFGDHSIGFLLSCDKYWALREDSGELCFTCDAESCLVRFGWRFVK